MATAVGPNTKGSTDNPSDCRSSQTSPDPSQLSLDALDTGPWCGRVRSPLCGSYGGRIRRMRSPMRLCRWNGGRTSKRHGDGYRQRGSRCASRQPGVRQHQSALRGFQYQGNQRPTGRADRSRSIPDAGRSGPGGTGSAQSAVLTAAAQVQKANSDLSGTMASEKSAESVMAKDRANALNAQEPMGKARHPIQ